MKPRTISEYNKSQPKNIKEICDFLEYTINENLKKSTSKIWHGGPMWFLDENHIFPLYFLAEIYYILK
jgi:hypothetical protein